MLEKLTLLEEKIEALVSRVERLQKENIELKDKNNVLDEQLATIQKEYEQLKVSDNDRSEKVKTKLTLILNRLNELEQIAS